MFGVPVCKGSGSRTAWGCVSVWGHGPASSTWHRNLWQQQSRVWLHHRPCVLQLERHWMILVHPVCLTLNTSNKEKKTEHWRSMWHLQLVVKNILYKVLQTVTPHESCLSRCCQTIRQYPLFVYRDFWLCNWCTVLYLILFDLAMFSNH